MANTGLLKESEISGFFPGSVHKWYFVRVALELVFHMSTHPSINYSSHYLSGQQWQSKWNLFTKSSEVHGVGTKRPTWSSTLMIPFLLFLFPLPGSHMSQTTSHNVHMWDRGHFPFMEARYLMVVITGIPNVISGTGLVWFLFSESGAWANCTYPTYPCFSLISIFLFNKK